ncbi:hypothetical protein [Alicyclobacillus acidocaldarius]|uniref:Uncharacterized protein n=1 Tax=Alicyclobacillus acidocaldarius (strain Tc-4-1) TaxID=1048834 RepID=F8IIK8_ALIAT|nr:hypothetical protein [Alicyclobacillus acidocaldarius]AEJ43340.1 hypothetical protein TC41_1404 [Alicyclobacillus acidocaldarius subsp. acidocaldarius Tc-4-1]
MVRQKSSITLMAVAFLALCGYMGLEHALSERGADRNASGVRGAGEVVMSTEAAPSDAEMDTIAASLADIPGLYDLAVLPDDRGDGQFVVSAMVEVETASGQLPDPTVAFRDMRADTDAYLSDLYLLKEPIAEAEITFTEGGTIVGTAGLGRSAYAHLAARTAGEDLAGAMEGAHQDDTSVDEACWIELKPLAN